LVKITLTIPDELYEVLKNKAKEKNLTIELLILEIVRKELRGEIVPIKSIEKVRRELYDLVNELTAELQRRINMFLERSEMLEERIEKARADIEELRSKVDELWEDYQRRLEWRRKRYKRSTS